MEYLAIQWQCTAAEAAHAASQLTLRESIRFTTKAILAQTAVWLATPVGLITALAATVYAGVKVVDALTLSFDESIEKLDAVNSKLEEQQAEYDALKAKITDGTINSAEKERLDILKSFKQKRRVVL